ncbi:hypothetical protein SAMD00019534_005520, partial [Acytostelium subglobosum LB1]|uniref:hypothetical protein n=1 Tax=Acytostelium subglobosum LB1 TaxID=1410327 RepID=UPI000644F923
RLEGRRVLCCDGWCLHRSDRVVPAHGREVQQSVQARAGSNDDRGPEKGRAEERATTETTTEATTDTTATKEESSQRRGGGDAI